VQPARPHEHWHLDGEYIDVAGTFFFLCTLVNGYSRYNVHWEMHPTMQEMGIETISRRAREHCPWSCTDSFRTTGRSS
jgi:hypothetical protein